MKEQKPQLIVNKSGYPEKTHDNEKLFESDNKSSAVSGITGSKRSSGTTANSGGQASNINSVNGEAETDDRTRRPRTEVGRGNTSARLSHEQQQQRSRELEALEKNDIAYLNNKQLWKQDNPNDTIKYHKQRYIQGKVDKLPWMDDNDKD